MHTLILLFIIVMMIITAIIIILIHTITTAFFLFWNHTQGNASGGHSTHSSGLGHSHRSASATVSTIGTEPRNAAAPQRPRLVARLRPAILKFDDEMT